MKYVILFIIFTFSIASITPATIINIPADQPTIQAGIDAAADGDTVLVQPGTYDEHTDFNGKNIVVGSLFLTTGDTSYISNTVIGGNVWGSVVQFSGGEDSTAVLTGFTITGAERFGGIDCGDGSSPTLMNLIINGNTAKYSHGAGINCHDGGSPTIVNITISGNGFAEYQPNGGGIACYNSKMNLVNVTISDNSTNFGSFGGGGICCYNSKMNLVNVTIVENTSHNYGGGISCVGSESEMTLVNTIVWNNSQGEIDTLSGSVNAFYCDIQGGWPGIGNIDANPMFVDAVSGDYRLLEGSPCIDKGIQDTFFVYNNGQDTLWIPPIEYMGSAPDIGAFESDPNNPITNIDKHSKPLTSYDLFQNYPNPFNPETTIKYVLPPDKANYRVKITIYDVLGQLVLVLKDELQRPGIYKVKWNGQNAVGQAMPSGVYICVLQTESFKASQKMLLVR